MATGMPRDYDDRPDPYDAFEDFPRRRRSSACQCFAPGEVAGTCPGPDNCPIARDDDEGSDE